MRILTSLFLLLLAVTNLFLVLQNRYRITNLEQVLVMDAARASVSHAPVLKDDSREDDITRGLALCEALRAQFGWGRFRNMALPQKVREAFWEEVVMDGGCEALMGRDLTIKDIYWGGNYAKVTFKETDEWLQINLWRMTRQSSKPWNPTGWLFAARLSLVEDEGVSL